MPDASTHMHSFAFQMRAKVDGNSQIQRIIYQNGNQFVGLCRLANFKSLALINEHHPLLAASFRQAIAIISVILRLWPFPAALQRIAACCCLLQHKFHPRDSFSIAIWQKRFVVNATSERASEWRTCRKSLRVLSQ